MVFGCGRQHFEHACANQQQAAGLAFALSHSMHDKMIDVSFSIDFSGAAVPK